MKQSQRTHPITSWHCCKRALKSVGQLRKRFTTSGDFRYWLLPNQLKSVVIGMKSYRVKLALRGISPMVWRRVQLPGTLSLAQCHEIIQILYGWEDEHLHQFHIYGKDYGIAYLGGMGFDDDADQVFLDDFSFEVGDKFTYVYNFFRHHLIDIRIEQIEEMSSRVPLCCTQGNGMPGVKRYDVLAATHQLLHAIADMNETTTIGKLRSLVDAWLAVKFNRRRTNQRLQAELALSP